MNLEFLCSNFLGRIGNQLNHFVVLWFEVVVVGVGRLSFGLGGGFVFEGHTEVGKLGLGFVGAGRFFQGFHGSERGVFAKIRVNTFGRLDVRLFSLLGGLNSLDFVEQSLPLLRHFRQAFKRSNVRAQSFRDFPICLGESLKG